MVPKHIRLTYLEKDFVFCRAALLLCDVCSAFLCAFSPRSGEEKKLAWRKIRQKNKNFFLTRERRRSTLTKCSKTGKIECFYKLFTICLQRLTEYIAENSKNCHFAVCALKEYLQVRQPLIGIIMQDDHKMLWFSQKCSPTGPKNR